VKKSSQVASLATLVALAAGLATAATKAREAAADSPLTSRFSRTAKVWKLSARNSARFAVMKVRGAASPAERRAQLDEQFAIRTAADVAKELGEMKGVLMKAGQLISFIFETLPDEAQAALATLQADAAPMAPSLAAGVVESELGKTPEHAFLDWTDLPVAAASIGQVHRAVTPAGIDVAVKVQYPGVHHAIESDLDAAEMMYAHVLGDDAQGPRREGHRRRAARARMREELDYELEARNVVEFGQIFAGHPWVRVPRSSSPSCPPASCSPPSGSTASRSTSSAAPPARPPSSAPAR
jgi:predicted unusual protein kinase regulating ubiquinone biosynthesis (AarF/ABC1/UbiB family)